MTAIVLWVPTPFFDIPVGEKHFLFFIVVLCSEHHAGHDQPWHVGIAPVR